jgi:peptidoglycan hydrolase-like protein with peptidoglycan-binding domain
MNPDMRTLFCRQTLTAWILAAMAAGGWSIPAAAAQSIASNESHKPATSSAATSHAKTTGTTAKKSSKSGKSSSRKRSRREKGQAAPTPDRIGEIQAALAKNNAYDGVPTGKWDGSTADALRKYQSAHGLSPTGKLDALTLEKLGLGSETAGVAAPTPPPNASVNRLLSRSAQREEIKNEVQPE